MDNLTKIVGSIMCTFCNTRSYLHNILPSIQEQIQHILGNKTSGGTFTHTVNDGNYDITIFLGEQFDYKQYGLPQDPLEAIDNDYLIEEAEKMLTSKYRLKLQEH